MAVLQLVAGLALSGAAHARDLDFSLYTGIPRQKVYFVSELTEWNRYAIPMQEGPTGYYSLSIEEPWLHHLAYKFMIDGHWMLDPENPDTAPDGQGGYNSIVATNFREDRLLFPQSGMLPMKRKSFKLKDTQGSERDITVVYPAVTSAQAQKRNVTIYFQDGQDYLDRTGVQNLLANLSAEPTMPLLTGVFIPPHGDRIQEYSFTDKSGRYLEFVNNVLVPTIEAHFPTGGRRDHRLVMGASMGGLISLQQALRFPQTFGYVASQSGSTWFGKDRIIPWIANAGATQLKMFLEVGTFEDPDMTDCNRKAWKAAQQAGLEVYYQEFPSTHDWIAWRNRLTPILRYFFDSRYQSHSRNEAES